jgi:hypothetical protein
MKDKFTLIIDREADEKGTRVGISIDAAMINGQGSKLSGSVCVIPQCDSYQKLKNEVDAAKETLDLLLKESEKLFEKAHKKEEAPDVDETMTAKEIWDLLSTIKDPEVLLMKFNRMSHQTRIEVADYVLTHCNVFSGPASLFSMRYNIEEGLLE